MDECNSRICLHDCVLLYGNRQWLHEWKAASGQPIVGPLAETSWDACQDFLDAHPLDTQNLDNSCFGNVQNSMTMARFGSTHLVFG